eukprot:SAG31_NODE_1174_length_9538_cov_3.152453_6_plen_157_part_00
MCKAFHLQNTNDVSRLASFANGVGSSTFVLRTWVHDKHHPTLITWMTRLVFEIFHWHYSSSHNFLKIIVAIGIDESFRIMGWVSMFVEQSPSSHCNFELLSLFLVKVFDTMFLQRFSGNKRVIYHVCTRSSQQVRRSTNRIVMLVILAHLLQFVRE